MCVCFLTPKSLVRHGCSEDHDFDHRKNMLRADVRLQETETRPAAEDMKSGNGETK